MGGLDIEFFFDRTILFKTEWHKNFKPHENFLLGNCNCHSLHFLPLIYKVNLWFENILRKCVEKIMREIG